MLGDVDLRQRPPGGAATGLYAELDHFGLDPAEGRYGKDAPLSNELHNAIDG